MASLLEREHYYLNDVDPKSLATALNAFISQYYQNAVFVPKTVVLPMPIESVELIENWLSEKRGSRVEFHVPKAGRTQEVTNFGIEERRDFADAAGTERGL